jgi:hypothetical protein
VRRKRTEAITENRQQRGGHTAKQGRGRYEVVEGRADGCGQGKRQRENGRVHCKVRSLRQSAYGMSESRGLGRGEAKAGWKAVSRGHCSVRGCAKGRLRRTGSRWKMAKQGKCKDKLQRAGLRGDHRESRHQCPVPFAQPWRVFCPALTYALCPRCSLPSALHAVCTLPCPPLSAVLASALPCSALCPTHCPAVSSVLSPFSRTG